MNRRGNVRNAPIADTVSALFVLNPIASEIPAQAIPKNATVKRMSKNPTNPVTIVAPEEEQVQLL